MADEQLPDWREPKRGTMVRAALWLVTQVGEGNVFTREDLRAAFPEVTQIDRRVRDLRDQGWVLHTNREDPAISSGETRFVRAGTPVWVPGARRVAPRARTYYPEPSRPTRHVDPETVWELLEGLTDSERSLILAWMAIGHRPSSPAERAWRALRSLPDKDRNELAAKLGALVVSKITDEAEPSGSDGLA
ncbi:hypothetical protein [Streptomyces sp. NPDC001381]|uniref:hypothetical protein n=1 Tax=Streptomyces sp. NPDC001381 TaxID=3364567 RepID=UPI00367D16F0